MSVLWSASPGPQTAFLSSTASEVLYGGAVSGGKTDALIAAPLRWIGHPKHRAIILRRERKRCQELIDRSRSLYEKLVPDVQWHETELRFKFPSGAFIHFGYAEHENDIMAFKSDEFNLVLFDELCEFTKRQYEFMAYERNRSKSADLPALTRAATNPDGDGMPWVYAKFIEKREPYKVYTNHLVTEGGQSLSLTQQFIPSTVFDNPHVPNRDQYIARLMQLDPETRDAVLYGRWDRFKGQFFPKAPREVPKGIKGGDWYVIRAMDYGWSDETCMYWLIVYPKDGTIEIAYELYASHLTTDSIVAMVARIEKELGFGPEKLRQSVMGNDAFTPGPDRQNSIADLLSQKGLWFIRANDDRVSGWAQLNNLIARDQLRCWQGAAPNLLRTLTKLPRDPLKPSDIKKRARLEDHPADAIRYGVMAFSDVRIIVPPPVPQIEEHRDLMFDKLVASLQDPRGKGAFIPELGRGF